MEQPGDRYAAPEPLRPVQDLVNTVDLEGGSDRLRTPRELTAWARDRPSAPGRDRPDCGEFDEQGLADVLVLREALRDVCSAHAGAEVPAGSSRRSGGCWTPRRCAWRWTRRGPRASCPPPA